jgi:23S rRNA (cytidine2498-2'-O)-methyltransferase
MRRELCVAFGAASLERLGPEVAMLETAASIEEVARVCRAQPVVFARHLASLAARVPAGAPDAEVAEAAATALTTRIERGPVALQVWASLPPCADARPDVTRRALAERLREEGWEPRRAGERLVIGVCLAEKAVAVTISPVGATLVDWPGGRVGLARRPEQISRAEFKLEEALEVFDGFALPARGRAIDLGAAPGGWTRLLHARGLEVWAVDPADLDPRVARAPGVHHVRTTAHRFLAEEHQRFAVCVNDMRMDPRRSTQVMVDAARVLEPDGLIVMTLKLGTRNALDAVQHALRALEPSYELLHARQLYHNRNEATVVARRRDSASA